MATNYITSSIEVEFKDHFYNIDFEAKVEYWYSPEERATRHSPHIPAELEVGGFKILESVVKVDGRLFQGEVHDLPVGMTGMIDAEVLAEIERVMNEKIKMGEKR